ncbi:MAG: hypothetical protein E6G13_01200 [Actinobacteria bacterium]|nr:MAG: hypothetical protein E6G13_01200 [Actinomycetota bacterium]
MPVRSAKSRPTAPLTRPGTTRRVAARREPTFGVFESKLRPPSLRPGIVKKTALINRLRRTPSARTVTLTAPAGYGKTTLLAQWAAAETRPVAWISLDARDNDPIVFLTHVFAAVDRIDPLDPRPITSLRASTKSTWAAAARRCLRAIASCGRPYLLVLDGADAVRSHETHQLLSALVDQIPPASSVAVAARVLPKLRLAALRAHGDLEEIGVVDLAFTGREAQLLVQAANPDLTAAETAELVETCDGWPAALYLASLSFRDAPPTSGASTGFAGDDRYLADYLRAEYLSRLHPRELRFLRRTSILAGLSEPLCNAVLQQEGSGAELEKIARANLFLVPLPRGRGWFRFHRLFRDLLLRELAQEEPDLIPTLHRRAADWYEAHGELEPALEHADAAADLARVAAIISALAFPLSNRGRTATLEQWLERFDMANVERYPDLAAHGSRIHALRGRAAEAERWLEAAERGVKSRDAAALRPKLAVVSAALCRRGARQMLLEANAGLSRLRRGNGWYPTALLVRGFAAMLLNADEKADSALRDAALEAAALGSSEMRMIATGERSLIARRRGDDREADELSAEASAIARLSDLEDYPTFAIALAASAHTSLRHGRWAEARELLATADIRKRWLTEALPWLAVEVRLELTRSYLTLRDFDAARALTVEVDAILELRPDLGVLVERARELRANIGALSVIEENARLGLTPAELRLVPLLGTHLSFREIAEQLNVSRNTVKTQAISIYRKLGVSGRSDAIAAATRLDPTRMGA